MSELLQSLHIPLFHPMDEHIQSDGDQAQDDDGHEDPVKLEYLTAIDNEKSKSFSGCDEFSDDHAYEAESDIHFHDGEQAWDVGGDQDLA